MSNDPYERTTWKNCDFPAIDADNLNNIEEENVKSSNHRLSRDNPHQVTLEQARAVLNVLNGNVDFNDNDIENLRELFFKDGGSLTWNADDFTTNLDSTIGPVLQVGEELWTIIYNGTGGQLDNGTVVYPVGQEGGRPSVDKSRADTHEKISRPIYVTTMDIPDGTVGIGTHFGYVRGIDTSALALGTEVYVSTTVDGELQSTKPEFPDYSVRVGGVTKTGVTDGEIFVAIGGSVTDTFNNFWNGTFRETINFTVSSDGTTVTGSLAPDNGHPDMTMIFSDGFTMLETTPAATITLTPGTDSNPQTNFVYVPEDTKVLTVSATEWPTSEHIKVATIVLRSAATTQTDGALGNRNWNDHVQGTSSHQGHLSHITERIRQDAAKWDSGVELTTTIVSASSPDDVYVAVTSGFVYQLHKQAFPTLDLQAGDDVHIVNDPVNPYDTVTNLNTQTVDSTGATLYSRHFSFVVWGVQNRTGEVSHLMLNLPGGSYNSSSGAISDSESYSNYSIPPEFDGTGFLIARITFELSPSGSGTWTLNDTQDLRGFVPNSTAGGGGSGGGGGVSSWTALNDTPNSYTGQAGNLPRVSAGETGLEFLELESGTPDVNDVMKWNGSSFIFAPYNQDLNFSIASFSDGQSSPQLIGSGVWKAAGDLSFTASYNNGPPTSADVSSTSWAADLDMGSPDFEGPTVSTEATNYPGSPNGSVTFTLTTSPSDTAQQSVTFPNTTLYGVTGSLSENGANEDTTYAKTINAGVGETIEFQIPDRLTDIAQVRVGGVTASFNSDRTQVAPTVSVPASYSNSAGYSENFVAITSTDTNLGTFSSSVETMSSSTPINFLNYGVTTKTDTYLESDVEGLANQEITNDNTQVWDSITANTGEYLLFAFPVRLGTVTFWVGGFEGGFESPETVTVTNSGGFQEDYYVWRSTNSGLGATVVETRDP